LELYEGIRRALGSETSAGHGPAKPGEQRRSSISARRLRERFGLEEPASLADGLARTASWFRADSA
jgi:UDP-glucose 4-epimerase